MCPLCPELLSTCARSSYIFRLFYQLKYDYIYGSYVRLGSGIVAPCEACLLPLNDYWMVMYECWKSLLSNTCFDHVPELVTVLFQYITELYTECFGSSQKNVYCKIPSKLTWKKLNISDLHKSNHPKVLVNHSEMKRNAWYHCTLYYLLYYSENRHTGMA
jgi:hypothetical protein